MSELKITLQNLEELKTHISAEIESAFQKQIDPLIKRIEGAEGKANEALSVKSDVENLKKNQARALVGWTILVMGVSILLEQAKGWIFTHLFHANNG